MRRGLNIGVIRPRHPGDTGASDGAATDLLAVHRAKAADSSAITGVISEAFLTDPTWSWAFPDPAARRQWWALCIGEALRYPWIFTTEGYEAVSVWIPPNGTEFSHEAETGIADMLNSLAGPRASEVGTLLDSFGNSHPKHEPHYYLSLLGVGQAHRGRGLGMALLEENLDRIDAEHMPAYLESSNPANNPRYQAVGFVPVTSFQAPGNGPTVTGMWRNSR